mgnify:CR=1 FL=1
MDINALKIVFMGTPDFAVESLSTLVENGCQVAAVVTQPDKPVGRHASTLHQPPVKQYALQQGLPVLQPEKMRDEAFLQALEAFHADLFVVVAFRMLPEVVWAMPRFGTFNVHAALLPQYRGAAPINWAVINGEKQTGVTTFFLDHDIDTGRIIMQKPFDIPDDADVEYVYDGLMHLGAEACLETVRAIALSEGRLTTHDQSLMLPEGTELHAAPKIFKETCRINWKQPMKRIHDFVRGLSPVPGAWTTLMHKGGVQQTMKIYKTSLSARRWADVPIGGVVCEDRRMFVAVEDGSIVVESMQMAGKKRMDTKDFLNGFHDDGGWMMA